jgi:hypothetical protein
MAADPIFEKIFGANAAASPSRDPLFDRIIAQFAESEPKAQGFGSNVAAGFRSGVDEMKGMVYGLAALTGDAIGHKELHDWGMKNYQAKAAEAEGEGVRVKGMHEIKSFSDFLDYTGAAIGASVPSLATTLAGGGVGGYVGKTLAKHAVESLVEKGLSETLAAEAVKQSMLKKEIIGGSIGAAAANYPSNLSSMYTSLKSDDQVKDAIPAALVSALGMSVLEAAPFAVGASSVAKALIEKEAAEATGRSILKSMGTEGAKMAAVMGATGAAETAIALGTHAAVNPNFDWKSKDAQTQILDSLGQGALMGTLLGVATGGVHEMLNRQAVSRAKATGETDPVAGDLATKSPIPDQPSEAAQPEAAQPEAAQPEAAQPEAAQPFPDKPTTANWTPEQQGTMADQLAEHFGESGSDATQAKAPLVEGAVGGYSETPGDQPLRYHGKGGTVGPGHDDVDPWSKTSHIASENYGKPSDQEAKVLSAINNDKISPEYVQTLETLGHIEKTDDGKYQLTDQGRATLDVDRKIHGERPFVEEDSTITRAVKSLQERMPDRDFEPVRRPDGSWVVAEFPKDVSAASGRFDPNTRTVVPDSQSVKDMYNRATKRADQINPRSVYQDRNQIFHLVTEDGQVVDEVKLHLPTITDTGRKLDPNGEQFGQFTRDKRGFIEGLGRLLSRPVEHRVGEDGKLQALYLKPIWADDHAGRTLIGAGKVIGDSGAGATRWSDIAHLKDYREAPYEGRGGDEPFLGSGGSKYRATAGRRRGELQDEAEMLRHINSSQMDEGELNGLIAQGHAYTDRDGVHRLTEEGRRALFVAEGTEFWNKEGAAGKAAFKQRIKERNNEVSSKIVDDIVRGQSNTGAVDSEGERPPLVNDVPTEEEQAKASAARGYGAKNKDLPAYGAAGSSKGEPFRGVRDPDSPVHKTIQEFAQRFGIRGNANELQVRPDELKRLRASELAPAERTRMLKDIMGFNYLKQKLGTEHAEKFVEAVRILLHGGEKGFWARSGSEHFIFVDPTLKAAERAEILGHEMGHMVAYEHFDSQPSEVRQALHQAHADYTTQTKFAKQDFHEWMANQFNRWIAQYKAPQTLIEKFFKAGADKLRDLWQWLKKSRPLMPEFDKFIRGVLEKVRSGEANDEAATAWNKNGRLGDAMWEGLPPVGPRDIGTRPTEDMSWLHSPQQPQADPNQVYFTSDTKLDPNHQLAFNTWTPEETIRKSTDFAKGWIKRIEKSGVGQASKMLLEKMVLPMDTLLRNVPGAKDKLARTYLLRAGEAGLKGSSETHPMLRERNRMQMAQLATAAINEIERAVEAKRGTPEWQQAHDAIMQEMWRLEGQPGKPNLPDQLLPAFQKIRKYFDHDAIGMLERHDVSYNKIDKNYFPRAIKNDEKFKADHDAHVQYLISKGMDEGVAREWVDALVQDNLLIGHTAEFAPLESLLQEHLSPAAQALKSRSFPKEYWDEHFNNYRETDLYSTMWRYGKQVADRSAYTEFYGMSRSEYYEKVKPWSDNYDAAYSQLSSQHPDLSSNQVKTLAADQVGARPAFDPHYKLHEMYREMIAKGANRDQIQTAINIHERAMGFKGKYKSDAMRSFSNTVMSYTAWRTLPLAPFGSLFDLVGPGVRVGSFRKNLSAVIQLAGSAEERERAKVGLQSVGKWIESHTDSMVMDGAHQDATDQRIAKFNEAFFSYTGMKHLDNFTRMVGWVAAHDAILDHAERARQGNKSSMDFLRELSLDPDHVAAWQAHNEKNFGTFEGQTRDSLIIKRKQANRIDNPSERTAALKDIDSQLSTLDSVYRVSSAMNRIVEESKALQVRPGEKPYLFNDARLAPFFQLKGFIYAFTHRTLGRMFHQLRNQDAPEFKYGWAGPVVAGMALMALGTEARQFIQYDIGGAITDSNAEKPTERMDAMEYMMFLVNRMGLTGLFSFAFDAYHAAESGKSPILSFFGPLADQAEEAVRDIVKEHWGRPIASAFPILNVVTPVKKAIEDSVNDE